MLVRQDAYREFFPSDPEIGRCGFLDYVEMEKRQNNETCMTHFAEVVMNTLDYDAPLPGCGLCQTAVPCEAAIPKQKS